MMSSSASTVRKFNFFEEVKSKENEENLKNLPSIDDPNKENTEITINGITPSLIDNMQAVDGIIFINGKAIHKINGKLSRESLIMKIHNNIVLDEYRIFNGVYYDFQIKYYNEKPLFVVTGGNFNKYVIKGREELFMSTSVRIYDAVPFINNKKYPVPKGLQPTDEQYPKLLLKQIKLLKKLSTNELVCDTEGDKMEGYESFQNIVAFAINSTFTHIAIGLDKGDILLISAYPNLFDCSAKEMKMKFLPKITPKDREIHITNLEFAELYLNKKAKRVLYASTASAVYYYEWNYETERGSMAENNIILKELVQDGKGAYSSCIAVKNNFMLLASSNNDFIIEYENLEFGKTWFFEGNKNCVNYFKDYIYFVSHTEKTSCMQIYDRNNKFFVYYNVENKNILAVCCDDEHIYLLYEESKYKKYIITLKEKENKDKFQIFYAKHLFDTAISYAESIDYDKEKISQIYKKYAEYEYIKGDFDKAINHYIKTINYLDPSLVIQNFLEKSKLDYLIKYLEAIENNKEFQKNEQENSKEYTILLLNCYIMQEKMDKLNEFLNKKGQTFSKEIIKTAIDVCLDTQNINLALSIAKQKNMNEEYLQILILKLNKLEEALDFIAPPENSENSEKNELLIKDKIYLFDKFGEYFLKSDENNKNIADLFFNRVTSFIERYISSLSKSDVMKLIHIFIVSDKYFMSLFEKMNSYGIEFNKDMIHRRIELYLSGKEENYKENILLMLKDQKYIDKYDPQYLMILFKFKEFYDGIEVLSEIINKKQELLNIYMAKREYEKIINLICNENNDTNISSCGLVLNYLIDKKLRKNMSEDELKKLNECLKSFLIKIMDKNLMTPIEILDIINEKNDQLPLELLNEFVVKVLEKQLLPLEECNKNINEVKNQINETSQQITELNTKATLFSLNLCDECDMSISFPGVCFRCGHCFHSVCLNANINEDLDKINCPKCKKKKEKVKKEINTKEKYYNFINENKNFKEEYEKSTDKLDFIYKLYGVGIFNMGNVEENVTKKAK